MLRLVHGWAETCSDLERKKRHPRVEIRHSSTYLSYVMAIWKKSKVV